MIVTNAHAIRRGQPMTLARIGIPAGLSVQTWQLDELRDRGTVDFYETGPDEVIVYLRGLAPNEVRTVPIDLLATVPGEYVAPASRAYLSYADDQVAWAPPVQVAVSGGSCIPNPNAATSARGSPSRRRWSVASQGGPEVRPGVPHPRRWRRRRRPVG